MDSCPCGSGLTLDACCAPVIAGTTPAPTAEALMRSRYTAYGQGNIDYLMATLATDSRADFDPIEAKGVAAESVWTGLEIRAVSAGGEGDDEGTVEYVARLKYKGRARMHHERATFRREDGQWRCTGGEVNPKGPPRRVVSVGRNEPCPCGSGKKYKKCCGA
ncbi:YchJ family protein [Roseospira marina]|uniref:YchJ family protein n=1 Tax=Roseospira marina TaxID=140057 RepID=A0A5M6IB69_9PROT|nr:YchJ family protein [Roseospira marina]KAA5604985.1 YchJ family protein [Roseospira marina]MBB4315010.1 SEC-C motif-containing protein [Roseospira marina]MBB5088010.1 SEC-C motif-containing protein [Roseospira marina]